MGRWIRVLFVPAALAIGLLCVFLTADQARCAEKSKPSTPAAAQKSGAPVLQAAPPSAQPPQPSQPAAQPSPPTQPAALPPPPPHHAQGLEASAPPVKSLGQGVFEIGAIRISKKEKRVEFPCSVNMSKGLLEYAIVGRGGKFHESLLRTDVEPYFIQIAMLLLGLEGTTDPLARQGDSRIPKGDPVSILVSWTVGSQKKEARIEEWIYNKKNGAPMQATPWVFTGSVVMGGRFMAQADKSIVAIYHDPSAIFDNPLAEGGSDEFWHANEATAPPPGTPVMVIIQIEDKAPNQ